MHSERQLARPVLRGKIVELRPTAEADIDTILAVWDDPVVRHRWPNCTREELLEQANGDDQIVGYTIRRRDQPEEIVGVIQYWQETEAEYRHAGIDIFLGANGRGGGLGTDAVRTVARFLFDELNHHRLTIDPAADNAAAIHCYEKVGFRPVGIMREYEQGGDGTWHDGLLMDLLVREFIGDDSQIGSSGA